MSRSVVDPNQPLRTSSIFSQLPKTELAGIEALARYRDVPAKRAIFEKGAAATEFYALIEGEARVINTTAAGKKFFLRYLAKGEVFGEIGVFDRAPRTATVEAVTDVRLAVFDYRDLRHHLRTAPEAGLALLGALATGWRKTIQLLSDQAFLKIDARLAKTLLQLSREFGTDHPEGTLIDRPFTQGELAEMVGTAREAINRLLGSWEKDRVLRREGDRIILLDPERLLELLPDLEL